MRTARQDYLDKTYEEAREKGCDTVQLKYDGWWARVEIINGQGKVYTQTNRELPHFGFQLTTEPLSCTVIGELMFGTQWSQKDTLQGKIFLFDCWDYDGQGLEGIAYRNRYAVTRSLQHRLPANFQRVQNFPINDYEKIWSQYVASGLFEGVVFRDSKAAVGQPVYRFKNTFTDDYYVIGFREGEGKHAGRLGALICSQGDVGGGLSDEQREEIWNNQDKFRFRYCQVEGRARFESGALRHPNFIGWRPEGWIPENPVVV